VDAYSLKPMDPSALLEACEVSGGRIVVAEDHHPEGGLGAAVEQTLSRALRPRTSSIAHLAVREMPMSGTSAELLDFVGISVRHIAAAARALVSGA
ncbi:MAG: transketolase C-terminal domain-containing protein, partial [Acidimicrobiales bacterium]